MHALIVENSKIMRIFLKKILMAKNFKTTEAINGTNALEKLKGIEKPDIIFVSLNIPKMNGYNFLQSVRARENYNSIPIVMMLTEVEMLRKYGSFTETCGYILKPFTKETVLEKLQAFNIDKS